MHFADIVVTLDPSPNGRTRLQVAARLAARASGRLTACYVGPTAGLRYDSTDSTKQEPAGETAEAVRDDFESVLALHGLSGSWVIGEKDGDVSNVVRHARCADLVVCAISPAPSGELGEPDVEALVTESGCPILGIPPGRAPDGIGGSIAIAWDDSREASRAVRDALPFLSEARSVRVISVGTPRGGRYDLDLLLAHLKQHGIAAAADADHSLRADSPAEEILSRLQDLETDLLVAGAFGHSRLGERLFGGASRTFLHQMMIPVLVSH